MKAKKIIKPNPLLGKKVGKFEIFMLEAKEFNSLEKQIGPFWIFKQGKTDSEIIFRLQMYSFCRYNSADTTFYDIFNEICS
jgi:hypothetical protein